jgi:hypothetical protein
MKLINEVGDPWTLLNAASRLRWHGMRCPGVGSMRELVGTMASEPIVPADPGMADGMIFEMDVRIRFVASTAFGALSEDGPYAGSDPWVSPELLDADILRRLEQFEPELMRWLAASPDNPSAFALDPIRVLEIVTDDTDAELILALRQLRADTAVPPWPSEARLRSIVVSVAPFDVDATLAEE